MAKLNFDSRLNYQKIFMNSSVDVSVANPNARTTSIVTHSLGYTPNVRVWFTNASGKIAPAAHTGFTSLFPVTSDFNTYACYYQVYSDTLRLILDRTVTSGATINSTIYYRIYLDAAS